MSRTALITGASSGIGAACAERFAEQGWQLVLLARRSRRLEDIKARLGVPCHIIAADVRKHLEIEDALRSLPEEFKDIEVLVNCAGVTIGAGPVEDRTVADWTEIVETNVLGLAICTKLVLPSMVQRNSGHIINLGSTAGSYPRPGDPVYCASKAFSQQFSLALRADLKGKGIRLTSIEPANVRGTEIALRRLAENGGKPTVVNDGEEYLTPADVAEAVWWTVSLPKRVNVNRLELMSICQTFSNLQTTSVVGI